MNYIVACYFKLMIFILLPTGRRSSSGQHRSRNQQQPFSGHSSGQRGQQQSLPSAAAGNSDPSKATGTPTVTKEAPSNKKPSSQGSTGSKSKEGKKGGNAVQQGVQNPSFKGVPSSAVPLQGAKTTAPPTQPRPLSSSGGTPTSHIPTTPDQKQTVSSNISPPGTSVEPTAAGQRRLAPSLSRNIQVCNIPVLL